MLVGVGEQNADKLGRQSNHCPCPNFNVTKASDSKSDRMQPRLGAHYTRGISLRFIIAIALFIGLSGCAVVGVTSAVVATTASVATLPVKAVGAAVKAVTPDGESEDDDEE